MNWRESSRIANFPEWSPYWTLRATVEKPKLRAVGNPPNVYNSIRSILLVLQTLQPILVFLPRSTSRYVIIFRQDFLLVLLVCLLFEVIHTDLYYKLSLLNWQRDPRSKFLNRYLPLLQSPQKLLPTILILTLVTKKDSFESSGYPSKTMNKTLCGSYQTIGKALAHGVPSQIANAVMKNPTLRSHVIEQVLKMLSKEVAALCSIKKPLVLRKSGKEDLAKFDLQLLCNECKERAPMFYSSWWLSQ